MRAAERQPVTFEIWHKYQDSDWEPIKPTVLYQSCYYAYTEAQKFSSYAVTHGMVRVQCDQGVVYVTYPAGEGNNYHTNPVVKIKYDQDLEDAIRVDSILGIGPVFSVE